MRVVLDTNVVVSGLLTPFGPPARVVGLAVSGALECAFDARILTEYDDVLRRRRLRIDPDEREEFLAHIRRDGVPVAAPPLPAPLPDRSDEAFVEVALAGGARCLVTGNGAHFPSGLCLGLPVLSPAELVEVVRRIGIPAPGRSPYS